MILFRCQHEITKLTFVHLYLFTFSVTLLTSLSEGVRSIDRVVTLQSLWSRYDRHFVGII